MSPRPNKLKLSNFYRGFLGEILRIFSCFSRKREREGDRERREEGKQEERYFVGGKGRTVNRSSGREMLSKPIGVSEECQWQGTNDGSAWSERGFKISVTSSLPLLFFYLYKFVSHYFLYIYYKLNFYFYLFNIYF